ncbi:MAG: TIGR03557 family F420-dependent LLM class oxidoreductase [Chloroflexia bacterium]
MEERKSAKLQTMIGFVLSQEQFPTPRLVELGAAAEKAGFDAAWASDHFQPWQDNQGHAGFAWLTLGALGGRTSRITMGTGVTCPTYRYRPAEVAQGFATLGQLYPGRVFLGVGTGEALNEQAATGEWGKYQERGDRLVEALEIIRGLWAGGIVNHQGRYYRVESAKLYDTPPQPIPIYIAAAGKNSMRLAGRYGDGLITDPKSLTKPELRAPFEEGCRAAGRDPATMPILTEHWAVVGGRAEAEKGAELWRFMPKSFQKYVNNPDPREIQRQAEQEVPLDKVFQGWVVSEDPQAHIEGIQKLLDDGARQVFVHSPQEDQERFIEFYGREVLPKVRGR